MLAKKYLEELMHFHEQKEAREAEEQAKQEAAKKALGKFVADKNKNAMGEDNKIEFLF